jgi:hypothetical protein
MVDTGMGHHNGNDVLGIAEPGVEQDQLVAGFHNQSVLLENSVIGPQEILG